MGTHNVVMGARAAPLTWWQLVCRLPILLILGDELRHVNFRVTAQRTGPELGPCLFNLQVECPTLHGPHIAAYVAPQLAREERYATLEANSN